MKSLFALSLTALILALACFPSITQGAETPPPGSPERKALLDALRQPIQAALKKPLLFKVDYLYVQDGWAFMQGVPLQPDGKTMNYNGTIYEEAIKDGAFDDWCCGLLKKDSKGNWKVIAWNLGATDVVWEPWPEIHKAPQAIFPKP